MLIAVPTAALIKIQFDRYLERREDRLKAEAKAAAEAAKASEKPSGRTGTRKKKEQE